MQDTELTPVTMAGEYLEVHPSTLQAHQRLGWVQCERREATDKPKRGRPTKAAPAPEAE